MKVGNPIPSSSDLVGRLTWNGVTGFIIIAFLTSFAILAIANKWEALPATLFTAVAAWFSFAALRYSREKFRLDLYEKRLEIYFGIVEFCSRVEHYGFRRETPEDREQLFKTLEIAQKCLRGLGYHRARTLFGDDIHDVLDKLNKSTFWLQNHTTFRNKEDGDKWEEHTHFVGTMINQMPALFRPYIYFGDYRN
jgi:hypothetical protein